MKSKRSTAQKKAWQTRHEQNTHQPKFKVETGFPVKAGRGVPVEIKYPELYQAMINLPEGDSISYNKQEIFKIVLAMRKTLNETHRFITGHADEHTCRTWRIPMDGQVNKLKGSNRSLKKQ